MTSGRFFVKTCKFFVKVDRLLLVQRDYIGKFNQLMNQQLNCSLALNGHLEFDHLVLLLSLE